MTNMNQAVTRETTDVDRLSSLPDDIIRHILKFMDAKFAVQTCVLSKRWNHLWTKLRSLSFDSKNFIDSLSFEKFVVNVLKNLEVSTLQSCDMFVRSNQQPFLDRVINHVAESLHVEQLRIAFVGSLLPNSFLTSESLKVLKLNSCWIKETPNSLNFPSLKSLHLSYVCFFFPGEEGTRIIDQFLLSCVNLENLELRDVYMDIEEGGLCLSCPNLVNLTISNLKFQWRRENGNIMVSAPTLLSFNYSCKFTYSLIMDTSPCLDTVNLDLYIPHFLDQHQFDCEHFDKIINIFQALKNATSLILSSDIIEVLSMFPSLLEKQAFLFKNLKSLKLKTNEKNGSLNLTLKVMEFLWSGTANGENLNVEIV